MFYLLQHETVSFRGEPVMTPMGITESESDALAWVDRNRRKRTFKRFAPAVFVNGELQASGPELVDTDPDPDPPAAA